VTAKGPHRTEPRKPPNLAQTVVRKDTLERVLPSLPPPDRLLLWSFRHKQDVIGALAGHDRTRMGFMTPKRIKLVFTKVLRAPGAEALDEMLQSVPTRDVGPYKAVVDYFDFATRLASEGVRKFNLVRDKSVLHQKVPVKMSVLRRKVPVKMPSRFSRDRPETSTTPVRVGRDLAATLARREERRVALEHRATKVLLRQSNFEGTPSIAKRATIAKRMTAYSGTGGKGARRAIASAKNRRAQTL